jgi:hypothetical protein
MKSKKQKTPCAKTCETDKTPAGVFYEQNKEYNAADGKNISLYEAHTGAARTEPEWQQIIKRKETSDHEFRTKPILELLSKGMLKEHVLYHRPVEAVNAIGRDVEGEWRVTAATMTYTVESMTHRFVFELSTPIDPKDIQIIGGSFLRTKNRIFEEQDGYKFLWDQFTELDGGEKAARSMANIATAVERLEAGNNRQPRKKKNPRITPTNPKGAGRKTLLGRPEMDAFLFQAWSAYVRDATINVNGQRSQADFFQKTYWKKMPDFKTHKAAFKKYVLKETRVADQLKAIRLSLGRHKTDKRAKRNKDV